MAGWTLLRTGCGSSSRGRATTSATSASTPATWSASGTATSSTPSALVHARARHPGWMAESYFEYTSENEAVVKRDYDASQLTVIEDEELEVLDEVGDWLLCRNAAGSRAGSPGASSRTSAPATPEGRRDDHRSTAPAGPGLDFVHARAGPGDPHPRGRQPRRGTPQPAAPGLHLERHRGRASRLGAGGLHRDRRRPQRRGPARLRLDAPHGRRGRGPGGARAGRATTSSAATRPG